MQTQIISKFFELPKTKTTWWAFGLGLTLLLGVIMFIMVLADHPSSKDDLGIFASKLILIFIVEVIVFIPNLISGIRSYKKGERSFVLWIGLIPAIIVGAILSLAIIYTIIGELLFSLNLA